jgi:hypothetical protein
MCTFIHKKFFLNTRSQIILIWFGQNFRTKLGKIKTLFHKYVRTYIMPRTFLSIIDGNIFWAVFRWHWPKWRWRKSSRRWQQNQNFPKCYHLIQVRTWIKMKKIVFSQFVLDVPHTSWRDGHCNSWVRVPLWFF